VVMSRVVGLCVFPLLLFLLLLFGVGITRQLVLWCLYSFKVCNGSTAFLLIKYVLTQVPEKKNCTARRIFPAGPGQLDWLYGEASEHAMSFFRWLLPLFSNYHLNRQV
jgi:hypothetical protein